jgi:hypothetical protein
LFVTDNNDITQAPMSVFSQFLQPVFKSLNLYKKDIKIKKDNSTPTKLGQIAIPKEQYKVFFPHSSQPLDQSEAKEVATPKHKSSKRGRKLHELAAHDKTIDWETKIIPRWFEDFGLFHLSLTKLLEDPKSKDIKVIFLNPDIDSIKDKHLSLFNKNKCVFFSITSSYSSSIARHQMLTAQHFHFFASFTWSSTTMNKKAAKDWKSGPPVSNVFYVSAFTPSSFNAASIASFWKPQNHEEDPSTLSHHSFQTIGGLFKVHNIAGFQVPHELYNWILSVSNSFLKNKYIY